MIRSNKRKAPTTPIREAEGRPFHLVTIDSAHLGDECDHATLGPKTGAALEELEYRRSLFLRCSGMHTEPVWWVIKKICKGETNGPGLSYVAPALYEGVPQVSCHHMHRGLLCTAQVKGFEWTCTPPSNQRPSNFPATLVLPPAPTIPSLLHRASHHPIE